LHRLCDNGLEIVVNLFGEFDQDEGCEIVREIEKSLSVMHPCIAAPFALVRVEMSL
jgi:hypothetical protein